jgi:3-deoxy-7-phosphoheptulonate synthase
MLVGQDVAEQIPDGSMDIVGCMIESHLHQAKQLVVAGQVLRYGQSITDSCLGFDDTLSLLEVLATPIATRA